MAAPLLLLPLLKTIGAFVIRHMVLMLSVTVATFLLDATKAYILGKIIFDQANVAVLAIGPIILQIKSHLETEWAAAADFLALANSLFPLDFALLLVGMLGALWITLWSIRVFIFIFRLGK